MAIHTTLLRRTGMLATVALATFAITARAQRDSERPPNIVVIFADDLGWGDLGTYGHPTISTPNLDRLAAEGQQWNSFYVAESVCSPSRGALLTGQLPIRSGLYGRRKGVLFPDSVGGINPEHLTIAEALKERGYATGMIGKWHLGKDPEQLPPHHGFDEWFGVPYSNDMMWNAPEGLKPREAYLDPNFEYWDVPLYRNDKIVEQPTDQRTITRRYGEEAAGFIRSHKDEPFFLYVPHSMPHIPLFRSKDFEGHSLAGYYGDVIEEIDWSVGRIVEALEQAGIAENTMVVFSSDNGPWLTFKQHGGSAGPLYFGKNTTWEGGMRVPGIFWWPGTIKPKVEHGMGSTLDLFPTIMSLARAEMPTDRIFDGFDLSLTLLNGAPSPRHEMPFYRRGELYAYRYGPHKIHFFTEGSYGQGPKRAEHDPPILNHLDIDPGEKWDIAEDQPELVRELVERAKKFARSVPHADPIFDLRPPKN